MIGFWDESLSADQDGEYAMRFLARGGKFEFCDRAWSYYRRATKGTANLGDLQNRSCCESRIQVMVKMEELLRQHSKLNDLRYDLSFRYARIANRIALHHKDLAEKCLREAIRLSPDGKLPTIISYPIINRILGISGKQKLTKAIRSIFGYPKLSSKIPQIVETVSNIQELFVYDE